LPILRPSVKDWLQSTHSSEFSLRLLESAGVRTIDLSNAQKIVSQVLVQYEFW